MRQKRAKAYKRLMTLYSQTFGFRQPFQVLVGADFMQSLENKQLDVVKQLTTCVQGECKPMITQCSMEVLYKLGREHQGLVDAAKQFERRRCNHREALEEDACVREVVGPTNKHRYTLAVQSRKLRNHLRTIPGIPLIHFNERGVMVLEPPSDATTRHKETLETGRLREQLTTQAIVAENIVTGPIATTPVLPTTVTPRTRKSGPKAPNPLSIKKKSDAQKGRPSKKAMQKAQATANPAAATTTTGAKRKAPDAAEEEAPKRRKD